MKSARKEDKFSNLIDLFQNLIDEENRQRTELSVNLIRQKEAENEANESKRENKKNEKDKKNKCFRCSRSSHAKEKCSTINSEYIECHKTNH